jgi:hypothetical protein
MAIYCHTWEGVVRNICYHDYWSLEVRGKEYSIIREQIQHFSEGVSQSMILRQLPSAGGRSHFHRQQKTEPTLAMTAFRR